jgi:hypothetical protein
MLGLLTPSALQPAQPVRCPRSVAVVTMQLFDGHQEKPFMPHPKILIQLDTDSQTSSFDSVVAVDAGVDHVLRYSSITPQNVVPIIHGAMFTRGGEALKNTAVFIGGSDIAAGEAVLRVVQDTFYGPIRVSVMLDSGGCNTTATAAVLSAATHVPLAGTQAMVLAATGPVGARVCRLLAGQGAHVLAGSRREDRASAVCNHIRESLPEANITPVQLDSAERLQQALEGVQVVLSAGAEGIQLLPSAVREAATNLSVVIDLNAVPPLGIEGIEVHDRATSYGAAVCYGAIGVGGAKMKIHKAAVRSLFEGNDLCLDAEEIFKLGQAGE